MIKAGLVNMDTSHPRCFADVMRRMGRIRYSAIYDDSFRSPTEIKEFMEIYGLEERCASLEELADSTDVGFIHGCNWDDHLRCAEPFWRRGKPVFIDKPLVGCLRDCRRVRDWAARGAVILGASSTRYAEEIKQFLKIPTQERGEIISLSASVGMDEFNYGIHIAEAIGGLLPGRAETVRHIGRAERAGQTAHSYCISFPAGQTAIMTILNGVWQPFALTVLTTKGTYPLLLDSDRLYESLLAELCDYLEGKPNHLASAEELLDSVEMMLAALASRESDGKEVALANLKETMPSYNGREFWEGYRRRAK